MAEKSCLKTLSKAVPYWEKIVVKYVPVRMDECKSCFKDCLQLTVIKYQAKVRKLSIGEICVANFLPPCEWGKSG